MKIDDAMTELLQSGHINNRLLYDYYMKLLDASHIEDDYYFLNIIQNDLKAVISDIHARHRKDGENATDINITDKINEVFDDADNYNGNLIDLLMYYFCKEIRLPLNSLSSEKVHMLRTLFQRSGRYKSKSSGLFFIYPTALLSVLFNYQSLCQYRLPLLFCRLSEYCTRFQ